MAGRARREPALRSIGRQQPRDILECPFSPVGEGSANSPLNVFGTGSETQKPCGQTGAPEVLATVVPRNPVVCYRPRRLRSLWGMSIDGYSPQRWKDPL